MSSSPFHSIPRALAPWLAVLLSLLTPAGARSLARPRPRPIDQLMQAAANATDETVIVEESPAFDTPFFSEDADRMAEMPPYQAEYRQHPKPYMERVCKPQCKYTCGYRECDQACEPRCLPPKCETLCTKSADTCETRCAKPKCAVICPLDCKDGNCQKCRSLCAAPACTTSCSGSCHSVCSQPRCTWKCHVGKCPKPACQMKCTGLQPCSDFPPRNITKVPLPVGMKIKEEGRASLDPKVLLDPPVAPPPPPAEVMPTRHPESSLGYQNVPEATPVPPVMELKRKWQAEDLVKENDRLLRR